MGIQQASAGPVQKEEALNAFRTIRGIDSSFEMRSRGADNAQRFFREPLDEYDFRKDPFGRYSPEGLRDLRDEATKQLNEFWLYRQRIVGGSVRPLRKDVPQLFKEQCRWSRDCTKVELHSSPDERKSPEPLKLNEAALTLFILLTEPKNEFNPASAHPVRNAFWNLDGIIDRFDFVKLVTVLHPEALERFVSCLGPRMLVELLNKINNREERELNEKFASAMLAAHGAVCSIEDFAFALASTWPSLVRGLNNAGEKGRELAGNVATKLEEIAERTARSMEDINAILGRIAGAPESAVGGNESK